MEERIARNFKEDPKGSHHKLIMECLKDVPDDEAFWAHLVIGDSVQACTKKTLFKRAFESMPFYFYCGWFGLEKDEHNTWQPKFCRIEQAAWDAANNEYIKDKSEWCAKWGCE